MPRYEYDRANCGAFPNFRSLAEYQMPAAPSCRDLFCAFRQYRRVPPRSRRARQGNFPSEGDGHRAGCRCCGGANFKILRSEWKKKLR
jgi:hypothetical protein